MEMLSSALLGAGIVFGVLGLVMMLLGLLVWGIQKRPRTLERFHSLVEQGRYSQAVQCAVRALMIGAYPTSELELLWGRKNLDNAQRLLEALFGLSERFGVDYEHLLSEMQSILKACRAILDRWVEDGSVGRRQSAEEWYILGFRWMELRNTILHYL